MKKQKQENHKVDIEMLKAMALFMCVLIIFFPIASTSAFAEVRIQRAYVQGEDGLRGVRQSVDTDTVVVEVSSQIAKEQISVESAGGEWVFFDECPAPVAGKYYCSYTSDETDLSSSSYQGYSVELDADALDCTSSCSAEPLACIDTSAPSVKNVKVHSESSNTFNTIVVSRGEDIVISYELSDTSSAHSRCAAKCAGIKSIEVHEKIGDLSKKITTLELENEDGCSVSGEQTIEVGSFTDGQIELCLLAEDNLGNVGTMEDIDVSQSCVDLIKDDTEPSVNDFGLRPSETGEDIEFLGATGSAVLYLELDMPNPDLFSINVHADLSAFGGGSDIVLNAPQKRYQEVPAGEEPPADPKVEKYVIVHPFNPSITESGNFEVPIWFFDEFGGKYEGADDVLAFSLQYDETGPSAAEFVTGHMIDGVPWVGPKNNAVAVKMYDDGAGFSGETVELIINGRGYTAQTADAPLTCSNDGSGNWMCGAAGIDIASSAKTIPIKVSGTDIGGNPIASISDDISYDNTPPEFVKMAIKSVTNQHNSFFIAGDSVVITAYFTDESGLQDTAGTMDVEADLSSFAQSGDTPADACAYLGTDEEPTLWGCTWQIDNIRSIPSINVRFKAADVLGNHNVQLEEGLKSNPITTFIDPLSGEERELMNSDGSGLEVQVFSAAGAPDEDMDLWAISQGEAHPNFVPARLTQLMNYEVKVPITLVPQVSGHNENPQISRLDPIQISLKGCSGDFESYGKAKSSYYWAVPHQEFPGIKSLSGDMKITFERVPIDKDPLEMTCVIEIVSKYNGLITQAEEEEIKITLPVNKIGELDKSVREKRDKALKNAKNLGGKWVDDITKWIDIATNLCSVLNLITTLGKIIYGIGDFLAWTESTLVGSSIGASIKSLGITMYTLDTGSWGFLYTFCGYITCQNAWVDTAFDAIQESYGAFINQFSPALSFPSTPADNFVLSVVSLCLPGILQGVKKMSEIECKYVNCINEQVPSGIPLAACSKVRNYDWCKLVVGELFTLVGLNGLSNMMNIAKGLLSNPFSAVLGVSRLACLNSAFKAELFFICTTAYAVGTVAEMASSIERIADSKTWDVPASECERAFDYEDPAPADTDESEEGNDGTNLPTPDNSDTDSANSAATDADAPPADTPPAP